jgi:SHS2 domain-containing protein
MKWPSVGCYSAGFKSPPPGFFLTGKLFGEKVDPERHQLAVEAKGATFTALKVIRQQDGQWLAECVIDV